MVVVPSALFVTLNMPEIGIGMLAGYALGTYLDPDADLVGITSAEGRAMRHWKILGKVWVAYWTFYGAMFTGHHRSFWSHFPFVSTAIRLVYLFWWVALLDVEWQVWHYLVGIGVWFGLSLADGIHYAADKFWGDSGNSKQVLRNKPATNVINKKTNRRKKTWK